MKKFKFYYRKGNKDQMFTVRLNKPEHLNISLLLSAKFQEMVDVKKKQESSKIPEFTLISEHWETISNELGLRDFRYLRLYIESTAVLLCHIRCENAFEKEIRENKIKEEAKKIEQVTEEQVVKKVKAKTKPKTPKKNEKIAVNKVTV